MCLPEGVRASAMSVAFITSTMLTKVMSWSTPGGRENQRRETTALPHPPRGEVCWSPKAVRVEQETGPVELAAREAHRGASGLAQPEPPADASVLPNLSRRHAPGSACRAHDVALVAVTVFGLAQFSR